MSCWRSMTKKRGGPHPAGEPGAGRKRITSTFVPHRFKRINNESFEGDF